MKFVLAQNCVLFVFCLGGLGFGVFFGGVAWQSFDLPTHISFLFSF